MFLSLTSSQNGFCLENKFINMFIFWEKEISFYLHFVSLEVEFYLCAASQTPFISVYSLLLWFFLGRFCLNSINFS